MIEAVVDLAIFLLGLGAFPVLAGLIKRYTPKSFDKYVDSTEAILTDIVIVLDKLRISNGKIIDTAIKHKSNPSTLKLLKKKLKH